MLDVGWPDPADVLDRTESTRSCWASSAASLRSTSVFITVGEATSISRLGRARLAGADGRRLGARLSSPQLSELCGVTPGRQPETAGSSFARCVGGRAAGRPRANGSGQSESRLMSSDAIVLLKADHKQVRRLFREFEAAGETAAKKKAKVVGQIIKMLTIHTY